MKLLYSTENSAEYSVMTFVRIESKKRVIYVYVCAYVYVYICMTFPGGSAVNDRPAMQEMWVHSMGQRDPLEKEILA